MRCAVPDVGNIPQLVGNFPLEFVPRFLPGSNDRVKMKKLVRDELSRFCAQFPPLGGTYNFSRATRFLSRYAG